MASAVLLLLTVLRLCHSQTILNAPSNITDWLLQCDSALCQDSIINCPTNANCNISCPTPQACVDATINWPIAPHGYGSISCTGYEGCKGISSYPIPDPNEDYFMDCRSFTSCGWGTIYCPTDANCIVKCGGDLGRSSYCWGAQVVWPINGIGTLQCEGLASCDSMNFPVPPPNEDFIFECGPHNAECAGADIHCPLNANCHIICSGENACNNAQINWGNGRNNTLTCVTAGACGNVNVPPTMSPTTVPTYNPTTDPTTANPTNDPTTSKPTYYPTVFPSAQPTSEPTLLPSQFPSESPSDRPSYSPTLAPTISFKNSVGCTIGNLKNQYLGLCLKSIDSISQTWEFAECDDLSAEYWKLLSLGDNSNLFRLQNAEDNECIINKDGSNSGHETAPDKQAGIFYDDVCATTSNDYYWEAINLYQDYFQIRSKQTGLCLFGNDNELGVDDTCNIYDCQLGDTDTCWMFICATDGSTNIDTKQTDNTPIIFGVIIGIIVCLCITLGGFIFYRMREQKKTEKDLAMTAKYSIESPTTAGNTTTNTTTDGIELNNVTSNTNTATSIGNEATSPGTTSMGFGFSNEEESEDEHTPTDNIEDVKEWLSTQVRLPQYYNNFVNNGFESLEWIAKIKSKQDLIDIGIKLKGHQMVIMEEINKMKSISQAVEGGDTERDEEQKNTEGIATTGSKVIDNDLNLPIMSNAAPTAGHGMDNDQAGIDEIIVGNDFVDIRNDEIIGDADDFDINTPQ